MLRITPSLLESFRYYMTFDFKSLAELEAQIKGEPVTVTPAMALGSAFHKVAEGDLDLGAGEHAGFYRADGLLFDVDSTDDALALRGPGVAEVWCSRQLTTVPYAPILRGRSDWLSGTIPYEIKTREKDFSPEDYAASLQWQCYLHMLGAEECRYLLVRLEERVEGAWWVRDADVLPLFRYAGMEENINQWARKFVSFCEQRNLLSYLEKENL
jgi:hypothetical protein